MVRLQRKLLGMKESKKKVSPEGSDFGNAEYSECEDSFNANRAYSACNRYDQGFTTMKW